MTKVTGIPAKVEEARAAKAVKLQSATEASATAAKPDAIKEHSREKQGVVRDASGNLCEDLNPDCKASPITTEHCTPITAGTQHHTPPLHSD